MRTDSDLAEYLGVNASTIANWRARNSVNLELIISKCDDLDLNMILRGGVSDGVESYLTSGQPDNYEALPEGLAGNEANAILDFIKKEKGLDTDSKLAVWLRRSPGLISQWRKNNRADFGYLFERFPDVPKSVLFGEKENVSPGTLLEDPEFRSIPFYASVRASAGSGLIADEAKPALEIKLRRYYIEHTLRTQASSLFGIIARGDSMVPDIEDGDMVVVDQARRKIKEHLIYAVRIDEEVYIKRISKLPGGKLLIRSSNERYPGFEVLPDDRDFSVLGTVVNLSRTLKIS